QTHSGLLSQQSNHQGSWVPPTLQQPTLIQKHGLRLVSTALGLAGGIGLLVSCIWSILLPAIGSIGVIGIACLANRKITPLHAVELPLAAVKSQNLFEQRAASKAVSGSLLDEPTAGADNLPPPILPMPNVTNQPNIPPPPPMPSSSNLVGESVNPHIPKTGSTHIDLMKPNTSGKSNSVGLSDELRNAIHEGKKLKFNMENAERSIKKNSEDYPLTLLLRELKTTYKRALDISKSKDLKDWEKYFADKVEKFENNFSIKEQIEEQSSQCMKNICEKTKDLHSLLENMQWIKSLLCILSERKDLSKKYQKHCSEKLKSIGKHIDKLQRCNEKKPKETASISTQDTSPSYDVADILIRRVAQGYSDSSSGSESGSDDANSSDWDD
ncbi:MAG: hypothetical protein C5B45_01290, partial [Chlamydiae bacterium]